MEATDHDKINCNIILKYVVASINLKRASRYITSLEEIVEIQLNLHLNLKS